MSEEETVEGIIPIAQKDLTLLLESG